MRDNDTNVYLITYIYMYVMIHTLYSDPSFMTLYIETAQTELKDPGP